MKLSIVIKSQSDFELILSLCSQIDKIQKEGKYLFYRFLCLCQEETHNTFKKCLKKYKVNVPYSILEFEDQELINNSGVVIEQMRDEIFRNPSESLLMIGRDDLNISIAALGSEYKMKILLVDSLDSKKKTKGQFDYIFPTTDPECWNQIVETIIKIYKL